MPPLVSIITRTKDRPLLLPRACESVLGQNMEDWEHIIVNDTGDPEPVEAIVEERRQRYGDRVQIIHRTNSTGMESASNAGISNSTGRYLVIHDDDDSWHPRFLDKTTALLNARGPEHPTQGVISHTLRIVEELLPEGPRECHRHAFSKSLQPIRLWRVLEENVFPPISFLFRRKAWEQLGPFNESLPVLGDWDFNVRFLRRFEIEVIPEMLAYYHHRSQGGSALYANTVTAQDQNHRQTEANLIESWSNDPDPQFRALAASTHSARANLMQRRSLREKADRISALRAEQARFESEFS